jgi:hypothetical protein
MFQAVSPNESAIVTELYNVASSGEAAVGFIVELINLRDAMVNNKDKSEVHTLLEHHKRFFNEECEVNIKHINKQLGFTHSPGVVSEATRLRETLEAACTRVSSLR